MDARTMLVERPLAEEPPDVSVTVDFARRGHNRCSK